MGGHRSRKTVLFVNELYVDLWPASPLGAIAKALDALAREQELDLSIVFALRDPVFAGFPIAALGYHVLPSPATPTFDHAGAKDTSFADVLLACRFARVHDLSRAVSAWDGLFNVIKPDVIVADTSPVVMLAARGRIPVMVTGSGFAVPPAGLGAFPPFGEDTPDETIQGLMLEVANMVLTTRNAPPHPTIKFSHNFTTLLFFFTIVPLLIFTALLVNLTFMNSTQLERRFPNSKSERGFYKKYGAR